MEILDLFRRDEVVGSRVLVCAIDPRFEDLVTVDSEVYRRFYPSTVTTLFSGVAELTHAVGAGYDIIHILCDVPEDGMVKSSDGVRVSGTELLLKCCKANAKLLWIACDNEAQRYINGFRPAASLARSSVRGT